MQLDKLLSDISRDHVQRSISEISDESKFARWQNGERAKEQAEQIVLLLVTEANKVLEQKGQANES